MLPFRSWHAGRNGVLAFLLLGLLLSVTSDAAFAQKGKNKGKQKGGKNKGSPSAAASESPGEQSLTNIPLPVGHDAKGLVLPDYDLEGRLRGKFVAGSAKRVDENHIDFNDLKITTYTPDNQVDLQIQMHTS